MRAKIACLHPVGYLSAICMALVLAPPAARAETPPPPAAKFVGVGDRSDRNFREVFQPSGCRKLSENLGICLEGSGLTVEGSRAMGRDRLETYRLDDTRTAALRSVFLDFGTAVKLSAEETETYIEHHIFDAAPHGVRVREEILDEVRSPVRGILVRQAVIARRTDGQRSLLKFSVFRMQYGLGLVETSIALPEVDDGTSHGPGLAELEAYHAEFLEIVRHSINVGPGY